MDTRRLIIGMVLAMAIVFGWQIFIAFLAEQRGWDIGRRDVEPPAEVAPEPAPLPPPDAVPPEPAPPPPDVPPPPVVRPEVAPDPAAPPPPRVVDPALHVAEAPQVPQPATLGSAVPDDPNFRMQLAVSPRGAGLNQVVLNQFRVHAETEDRYNYQHPYEPAPDRTRPLSTRHVTINGRSIDLSTVEWHLEQVTDRTASYYVDIADDTGPLLRVGKRYELSHPQDPDFGYEVLVTQSFENVSGEQLSVSSAFNGPTVPHKEMMGFDDRQIIAGYDDNGLVVITPHFVNTFSPDTPSREMIRHEGFPLVWAGASSVYFNAIVRPASLDPGQRAPAHLRSVRAEAVNPEAPPDQRMVSMLFETEELTLPPHQQVDLPLHVFLGPKKRIVLKSEYYAAAPMSYDRTLGTTMHGCAAFCTFDWLVSILVWMLLGFHALFRDWGLAIIGLVVVVRLLLHPITKRSTISMYKMGKMGPEIERLKKKHGDNKEELNKAMMQFYREQGFTPVLGCLPMFLQMPIWIALWQSLQQTFELRHAPFLEFAGTRLTWIIDLSRPDRLISWEPIPLFFGITISSLNLLPLLLAVVFYLQFRMTPKPEAATEQQRQQQKMMQWMMLLFPIFLYGMPSGLNLYILTSTTIGIIESKRIRDHIKAKEEAEKAERVIVEAKPTRGQKKGRQETPPPKKKGGILGWFAELQNRAEDIRRQNERRR